MKKLLSLLLVASTTLSYAAIVNGTCGENLTWSLDTKDSTLTIEGSGEMMWDKYAPWEEYRSYIAHVSLPNGLTSIKNEAFSSCYNLTSIKIPNSVINIENYAFSNCFNMTAVTFGNSIETIGYEAFGQCKSLKSIELPNSVKSIGEDAFYKCSNLVSVTIPNSVTNIGGDAFSYCYSLTSVTIPSSVTSIGNFAFSYCSGLNSITCEAITPPSIGEYTFTNYSAILYVPSICVDVYQNAITWEKFTNIQAIMDTPTPNDNVAFLSDKSNPVQKLIRNGNLYILTDDSRIYTLTGQEVR